MNFNKKLLAIFALLLFCFACNTGPNVQAKTGEGEVVEDQKPTPLVISLSDGKPADPDAGDRKIAEGTPLSPTRVEKLLKMFTEPLETEKDKPGFLKRPSSKPAPRSATPKEMPFPPKGDGSAPATVTAEALKVLSVAPDGPLERAPRLSISFNNPMIEVSDPSANEQGDPLGIKIEPRPPGKWRWLGTQTVIFEPTGAEFPRATEYKVTIPSGIADVNGSALTGEVTQNFSLPRPKVEQFHPQSGGLDLEPLIYLVFDQPIEADKTLPLVHLKQGSTEIPLQNLTAAQADKMEEGISKRFDEMLKDRVFFFKAGQKLKPGTSYTIVVDKGIKSAEGPLTSQSSQTAGFSTYGPLVLSNRYPQKGEEISPFNDFYLYFSNGLDEEKFDPKWVTVTPPIENMKIRAQGSNIYIGGIKSGKTTYKVKVSTKLKDIFGQNLQTPVSVEMKTGRAPKALSHGFSEFTLLDPTVEPGLPIYTTNIDKLDLIVHKVTPKEWKDYLQFRYDHQRAYTPEDRRSLKLPGTKLAEKSVKLESKPDQLVSTRIDLSEYFDDREGNVVVWVKDPTEDKENYRSREFFTWVQGSKIGIDIEVGVDNYTALITKIADGKPLSGAIVKMGTASGQTDAKGSALVDLPTNGAQILEVEHQGSVAFIPFARHYYSRHDGWKKRSLSPQQQWFLFDDRGLYKPGEKAKIKGYVRAWNRGPKGQLVKAGQEDAKLTWVLNGPRGNKLKEGTTTLNGFSAMEIELEFPPETNLGNHQLRIDGPGLPTGYHSLNVQEFRRPEFEVSTKVVSDEPHLLQGAATVEATAAYYAGGGLAGSTVDWSVSSSASSYTPPGRGKYTFGQWSPWWDMGCWWIPRASQGSNYQSFQGKADGEGTHQLAMAFEKMYPPKPTSVTATATVADVNRQQQSSTTNLLVHPSERYVGLKAEKSFVDESSDFEMDAIVTDIDGRMLVGIPVNFQLIKVEYEYSRTKGYHEIEKLIDTQKLTSAEVPSKIKFSPKEGGTYRIKASVRDDKERLNQTEYTFWKAGGELPSRDKVELENLTLVPDRKEYKPGDTARILVMAPFQDGEGTVVWSRDGLESHERFTLKNGTATIEKTLTEEMIPNLRCRLTAVGKTKWGKRERPAVASAALNLSISKESRTLTIELKPSRDKVEPGAEIEVPVVVKDHTGEPLAGAEVTLWIVDEAVLGLTGYSTPNPLGRFYGHRPNQMTPHHNRTFIALADPEMEAEPELEESADMMDGAMPAPVMASAPGGGAMRSRATGRLMMKKEKAVMNQAVAGEFDDESGFAAGKDKASEPQQFAVRKNFDAMAIFKGHLETDASGQTTVKVKLPDNLTRYRVMSVAVKDGDLFGSGDHLITARLPIMVRPSLPRFLNFGDKAKLPVVIQNQTDEPLKVDLVGEATGITWIGASGQSIQVPANDRVEVQFEAEASAVGRAHFRFGAVSGGFSDAATLSLPVYTPASGEAFATYGNIGEDGAIRQPVRRPMSVWTQFGGLDISLSSTALSELTDCFMYLYEYPYECAEQKSSRILAIAAMKDVLNAFNPDDMPTEGEIKARMKKDTIYLERLQNSDGGWQYWRRDEDSVPFVSLHVMHALARAKVEGYEVNQYTIERGLSYLRDIESHCRSRNYGQWTTQTCKAYALYVRNLLKDQSPAEAKTLYRELASKKKNPNLEAIGWLWPTLTQHAKGSSELAELKRLVLNRATQTADKAQFSLSFGEGDGQYLILHSSRRTDAILLAGLLGDEPKNQLNTKLVRGLLAHRKKGRWNNTQENIWILLALQSYFREYEKETPNLLASLWLDGGFLGEEKFQGRTNKEAQLHIPMAELSDESKDLIVGKKGPGRLYYRIGMKYAPKSLRLPAENRGFLVERSYKGIDSEDDVKQSENGDWEVKAGAKVEVTLTMVAPERRYHVALVDQLPAGLEPLNPALKGTPPTSNGGSVSRSRRYWWWRWYEHENLRDERVEAFASLVYPGVYTYSYTALATTPGEYVLPPLKAEEMYSPEVFGRTATARFVVK